MGTSTKNPLIKKEVSTETFVFGIILLAALVYLCVTMGVSNFAACLMATAFDLLINTCFYIMAIAVIMGTLGALFTEFGITALINKVLSPLMKPLFGVPGCFSLAAVACFLSDCPAGIPFVNDPGFARYIKRYQAVAVNNIGYCFGMNLIVSTYFLAKGEEFIPAVIIGNIACLIGGIVAVRIMLHFAIKQYGKEADALDFLEGETSESHFTPGERKVRPGSVMDRILMCINEGGKNGVKLGMDIIPGVLVICTIVMMLTFGPSTIDGVEVYTGAAYEGVALLPKLGEMLSFILTPLFGFSSAECISLPLVSLGAVGSAMGLAGTLFDQGLATVHDIATFIGIGCCYAGFLGGVAFMMEAVHAKELTLKCALAQAIGGIVAGVIANYAYVLIF